MLGQSSIVESLELRRSSMLTPLERGFLVATALAALWRRDGAAVDGCLRVGGLWACAGVGDPPHGRTDSGPLNISVVVSNGTAVSATCEAHPLAASPRSGWSVKSIVALVLVAEVALASLGLWVYGSRHSLLALSYGDSSETSPPDRSPAATRSDIVARAHRVAPPGLR